MSGFPYMASFEDRYEVDESSGCWLWKGAINSRGYGINWTDGRAQQAHRVAYERLVGAISSGLQLDHLCRNRGCVNPAHLEPVTARENVRRGDGIPARNARKVRCVAGHSFDAENTYWRSDGSRGCRACKRVANEKWLRKKKKAAAA